jgi:E3 ubiquitin-protein ligase CCNP1IP1
MDERDIRVSEVQPELVVLQRKLAGYSPNDMLTAVAYGIKFWNDQIEIRYGTELEKSFTSAQRNAEMYKRKLQVRKLLSTTNHIDTDLDSSQTGCTRRLQESKG